MTLVLLTKPYGQNRRSVATIPSMTDNMINRNPMKWGKRAKHELIKQKMEVYFLTDITTRVHLEISMLS